MLRHRHPVRYCPIRADPTSKVLADCVPQAHATAEIGRVPECPFPLPTLLAHAISAKLPAVETRCAATRPSIADNQRRSDREPFAPPPAGGTLRVSRAPRSPAYHR